MEIPTQPQTRHSFLNFPTFAFIFIIAIGTYFVYVRPKINVFDSFKNDPNISNYILIIESNQEFDKRSYTKSMKHLKLFLMYYSQSFDDSNFISKMKHQHHEVMKYLNRMVMAVPNSMRRHTYMKNAVENMDHILATYIKKASK